MAHFMKQVNTYSELLKNKSYPSKTSGICTSTDIKRIHTLSFQHPDSYHLKYKHYATKLL